MKLEVRMYVRTKYGISKIVNIFFEKTGTFIETDNRLGDCTMSTRGKLYKGIYILEEDYKTFIDNNVKNTIIDLIEKGDYVNGKLVTTAEDVYTEDNIYIRREIIVEHNDLLIEEDIETLVTKEQFESCMYKVKE